jgi:glycerophosphoryl diester phosphodiesterase
MIYKLTLFAISMIALAKG